jgi:RHS repeat-associated protein
MGFEGGSDTTAAGSVISLPKGGGAVGGLGEKFSPDLFTGTGNFSVPIEVPAGRLHLQPALALDYSTGAGNGPFGLGWQLAAPGITRRTAHGVPRYDDTDVFVLSGAEDLVRVPGGEPGRVRYRPRTEGLFARIEHVPDPAGGRWEVRTKDGLVSTYGAAVRDPAAPGRVFSWRITQTADPNGNLIRYEYRPDGAQLLLSRISYADYGDPAAPDFLVTVDFDYASRPDRFADHRPGFALVTSLRCTTVRVSTHAADGQTRVAREYRLAYTRAGFNGVSLLAGVTAVGIDGTSEEPLPPVTFGYSGFDPAARRFERVAGGPLPDLTDPATALVDVRGAGMPDLVQFGVAPRYWRNTGTGRFEAPRSLSEAPSLALDGGGVRLLDADGDGRPDLVLAQPPVAGYFPMAFGGGWSRRSFQPYRHLPPGGLGETETDAGIAAGVRLVDLDGDGLTDVLRSGNGLRAVFNDRDPRLAWSRTAFAGLDVDLSDPRIRLADLTGDGLADLVLVRSGAVEYWPNLGHGRWGPKVAMRDSPRLPDGFDPRRLLFGDVDGDGAADLVYVDHGRVLLWGNLTGAAWTAQPVVVTGTPEVVDTDAIELCDLHGSGMAGLLYGRTGDGSMRFLDFAGGVKPHLLTSVDNHLGARTTMRYRSSTVDFVRDAARPGTRWRTTLPFPVQVVAAVEVTDAISGGRVSSVYRYHHGYWDGVEREFRGFAMVETVDTEAFDGGEVLFTPPTLTKTWFHAGPVAAAEAGDWAELDLRHEYWPGDPPRLTKPALAAGLSRTERRDALRALRGRVLRSELYGLDGTAREALPYTVTEAVHGVRVEAPGVSFPFEAGTRSSQWERGTEPMTGFTFTDGHDAYGFPGRALSIAVPRVAGRPYLATVTTTTFARRDDARYIVDRVATKTTAEVRNDGGQTVTALRDAVVAGQAQLRVIEHNRMLYDGDAFTGLPVGTLGEVGLVTRVETLAVADGFLDPAPPYLVPGHDPVWTAEYPVPFRNQLAQLAGYLHRTDDVPGYYVLSERHRHGPRGLVVASLDPGGAESRVGYDEHDLLPVTVVDPAGLVVAGSHDRRLLRVHTTTDVNGNTTSVTYSPAGLVTEEFVRGKQGEGDQRVPSIRTFHDLGAFDRAGAPASVRTVRRVHHDADAGVPAAALDEVIVAVNYHDGFGRVVQTREQAEDVLFGDPAFGGGAIPAGDSVGRARGAADPDNVVVSGLRVYDNKSNVVRRFEPFFATGFDYAPPSAAQLGRQVTLFYDPRGHLLRTLNPDGSEERVVFGAPADLADPDSAVPSPWETYSYDANDNAGRTHGDAAGAFRDHWNTPDSAEFDALGRKVRAVARTDAQPGDQLVTGWAYDIQGNLLSVTDPLGRVAFAHRYDLLGRQWRTDSIDAGRQERVFDAVGNRIELRDGRGAMTLLAYDLLRRQSWVWARNDAAGPVTLRELVEYGDGGTPDQPPQQRDAARAANLIGRPVRHFDEAGLVTLVALDFKANVLESRRQVVADAPILATYAAAAVKGWQVAPFQVDWTKPPGDLLDPAVYTTSTAYDGLNRVVSRRFPVDVEGGRRELRLTYNRGSALESIALDGTVHVERIAYDAKGQRTLVAYGNGVLTRHAYDPETFRLRRTRSEHHTRTGVTYHPTGAAVEDRSYDYDLVGNVLAIHERAPGCGLPGSPDALDRSFDYDPLYRLVAATGRESAAPPPGDPWLEGPRGTDVTKTQPYAQKYGYDAAGNLAVLVHAATGGTTRQFTLAPGTNRLEQLTVGKTAVPYTYDAAGNLVAETTSRHFGWNAAGRLVAFGTQVAGAEPSVHAQYLYDSAGVRVKKLVRKQGGSVETTTYVDEVFEHRRWASPVATAAPGATQNTVLHVMDAHRRLAAVRIGPAHPLDQGPAVAVHLGDHLGSRTPGLDGAGTLTNREEYSPYGETTFGSYTRKRYRYTGRERDEESGLSYHQARYYAPWLGRWASVDPLAGATLVGSYDYCHDNPLRFTDLSGAEPKPEAAKPAPKVDAKKAQAEQVKKWDQEYTFAWWKLPEAKDVAPNAAGEATVTINSVQVVFLPDRLLTEEEYAKIGGTFDLGEHHTAAALTAGSPVVTWDPKTIKKDVAKDPISGEQQLVVKDYTDPTAKIVVQTTYRKTPSTATLPAARNARGGYGVGRNVREHEASHVQDYVSYVRGNAPDLLDHRGEPWNTAVSALNTWLNDVAALSAGMHNTSIVHTDCPGGKRNAFFCDRFLHPDKPPAPAKAPRH